MRRFSAGKRVVRGPLAVLLRLPATAVPLLRCFAARRRSRRVSESGGAPPAADSSTESSALLLLSWRAVSAGAVHKHNGRGERLCAGQQRRQQQARTSTVSLQAAHPMGAKFNCMRKLDTFLLLSRLATDSTRPILVTKASCTTMSAHYNGTCERMYERS